MCLKWCGAAFSWEKSHLTAVTHLTPILLLLYPSQFAARNVLAAELHTKLSLAGNGRLRTTLSGGESRARRFLIGMKLGVFGDADHSEDLLKMRCQSKGLDHLPGLACSDHHLDDQRDAA